MLNPKILEAIESQFTKERFLFWYDTEQAYLPCIKECALPYVKLVETDVLPALAVKLDIAQADSQQKFLFYSTKEQPDPKHDWLLSYRLKGKTFSADQTQILMDELGLSSHTLRPHLKVRGKFFAAKERVERLKRWTNPQDSTYDVDLKILTVLARAEQAEPFSVFNRVLSDLVQEDVVVSEASSRIWGEITQYELDGFFWELAKQTFSYLSDKPSLKNLMMCLLITDMTCSLNQSNSIPQQLSHFVLNDAVTQANARVFVSRWRSDVTLMPAYIQLSQALAEEMQMAKLLGEMSLDDLMPLNTFGVIEQLILTGLKQKLLSGSYLDNINALIQARRDGFWANQRVTKDFELTKAYAACYDAIESAYAFFSLKEQHNAGFSFATASEALEAYKTNIFRFDQTYRHFHYAASLVEHLGWGLLHDLVSYVENGYSGWFIPQFSSAWDKVVDAKTGLLTDWKVDGWTNQYDFYQKHVQTMLNGNIKRVFVLISDAFRYEAAEELMQLLNAKNKFQASIEGMLGVLPSYTSLGMASLLPHHCLKYKRGQSLTMLADNLSTAGVEQRANVLANYQGTAIKHEELVGMGKEKGREFVKPHQVIYIYHDRVDAIGDKQATETKTFEAVAQSVDELAKVINFVFGNLGASTLLLTADHGFMYQESALESADKSNLLDKPQGAYLTKKRYLIGDNLGKTSQAWCGNTHVTAGTEVGEGSLDFWVPKGASRFHFTGGARFVHGSAMPQEIVVPLLTVKQLESEKNKTKYVEIALLGSVNKIVNNVQRFELIQTEAVSDYVLPRTVRVAVLDEQATISDELVITLDKTGKLLDERKLSVMLTLKSGDYDRTKEYYLSIKDIDSGVEVLRQPIKIDLAFSNDF